MLTDTNERQHIAPVLPSLDCLLLHYRIQNKTALMVLKPKNLLAPTYVVENTCMSAQQSLRSSSHHPIICFTASHLTKRGLSFCCHRSKTFEWSSK